MGRSASPGWLRGDSVRAVSAVVLAAAVVASGAAGSSSARALSADVPDPRCADPVLHAAARGEAAVRALGQDLASVAAQNKVTGQELAADLRDDRTLWLDECGALLFRDEVSTGEPMLPQSAEPAGWPVSVPPADAFTLHSRPGSSRVLFLDFDGHLITNTAWNTTSSSWMAPPFSTDADPESFSDSERAVVIDVWRRVAQDFAPFGVDVTTQDPGQDAITRSAPTDQLYGSRVLISPDALQSVCGCGGQAYVDVFDNSYSHAYYQPAWVYPQALSSNSKYIAEAASHEAGHNLGLSHDGTQTASYFGGSGGWGPIMGAPYAQAVTQWSNGSYPGANNTQDDLAVIAGNGAPLVADDIAGATALAVPGSATGLVNGTADVDSFTLSAPTGTLTVTVTPHWPGPNLDAAVTLRDSTGSVVAAAAPAYDATKVQASLSATVAVPIDAGTYTVSVEGVGNGVVGTAGESDYGSAGWYTIAVTTTGTPTPTPTPTVTPTVTTPTAPTTVPLAPTAQKPVSVAVTSLVVQTRTLPTAVRKKPYRATLSASGGSGPYSWTRSKGSLPKGLTLSRSGAVTGKAKARGTKKVRVRVTDSAGTTSLRWVRIRVR